MHGKSCPAQVGPGTASSDKERAYLRSLGWAEVWLAMTSEVPLFSGYSLKCFLVPKLRKGEGEFSLLAVCRLGVSIQSLITARDFSVCD